MDSSYGCGETWLLVGVITPFIVSMPTIAAIALLLTTIKKFNLCCSDSCYASNEKTSVLMHIRLLCTITVILFIVLMVIVGVLVTSLLYCPSQVTTNSIYTNTGYYLVALLGIPYVLLIFLFANKSFYAFDGTVYQISIKIKFAIYLICFIQSIFYGTNIVFVIIHSYTFQASNNETFHDMYNGRFLILLSFSNVLFGIGYAILVQTFIKQIRLCSKELFRNNTKKQNELFNVAIKQFVCVVIAVLSTIASLITHIIIQYTFEAHSYTKGMSLCFGYFVTNCDFLTNILCLVFQYSQFETWYYRTMCCKYFDTLIKKCYNYHNNLNLSIESTVASET